MDEDLNEMTLWELIRAYGREEAEGGMGYTFSDSDRYLEEIRKRLVSAGFEVE
jgi:hypothetical protein